MDIQDIISSQGPALLSKLQSVGLSADQAKDFLPAASEQVSAAVSSGGIASLLGGDGVDALIKNIDIGAIAEKVGIDKALAEKALQSLVPMVMEVMQGGGGGAAAMLGGLAGKLFK
ncbi:MAG: hypothetical protein ACI8W7_001388 [Gammaproteobacteria bacterium]